MDVQAYRSAWRDDVPALSIRAWRPVFAELRAAVPAFMYDSFYPHGWEERQLRDLVALLDGDEADVAVAVSDGVVLGWLCLRFHPENRMSEIYVLAVDPAHQRRGVATALMDHAVERSRAAGLAIVMVETGGDPGHAASRATYESAGFVRWPVARYFKDLA